MTTSPTNMLRRQEHNNLAIALQEARARLAKAQAIAINLGLTDQVQMCEQTADQLTVQINAVNTLISRLQAPQTYVGVAEL